jgi:protein-S-isoprenylcysteine O-methyltransferase Ste14
VKSETAYLLAIVALTTVGVGAVVILDATQPNGANVTLITQVLGILTPTLAVLISLLKSVQNGQAIQQAAVKAEEAKREAAAGRQELRQNTEATLAISEKLDTVVPPGGP